MNHHEKYGDRPYLLRKKFADDLYIEIIDVREKNGRTECLSRWHKINADGTSHNSTGYRWRKVCGKGIFDPFLGRFTKDDHSMGITIRHPFSGRMSRAYLKEFGME